MTDNLAHALSGAGGGMLAMVVTYPLITLSTRAQVEVRKVHASTFEAVQKILEKEGLTGLYTGLRSALFGIGVTNGVYYYFYEAVKDLMEKARDGNLGPLSTGESMLAGMLAGSATVFATNPIWVVNTRVTARKDEVESNPNAPAKAAEVKKPFGTIATLMSLIREEGFAALWTGVAPALVLVINPVIQYTIFEQIKNYIQRRRKLTPFDAFLIGALGKLIATGSTYPYITLKARMQLRQSGTEQYTFLSGFTKILKDEGVAGLYKGIGPKILQSVLTAALLFGFKEQLYVYTRWKLLSSLRARQGPNIDRFAQSQAILRNLPGQKTALTSAPAAARS